MIVLSYTEFNGLVFTCTEAERKSTSLGICPIPDGTTALQQMGMASVHMGKSYAILVGLTVLFLLLSFVFLKLELTRS
jgi:hypothetical protein